MKKLLINRYGKDIRPLARKVLASITRNHHEQRMTWHQHRHGQLVFAVRGVVRVLTPSKYWTLPPSRAVWIPSYVDHELHAVGETDLCSVYIEPDVFPWPWREPAMVAASTLMRELAILLSGEGHDYAPDSRAALSAELLLKLLAQTPREITGGVPLPTDARLQNICEHVMEEPANDHSLDMWGDQLGASGRTLARRFKSETGMTFVAWRQHLRVAEAIPRLVLGEPVAQVSLALGYSSASAFVAMFKQVTGEPPQRYLASR